MHVKSVVINVELVITNCEDIVRDLFEELVGLESDVSSVEYLKRAKWDVYIMSIDTTSRETIRKACSVVQVAGVHE